MIVKNEIFDCGNNIGYNRGFNSIGNKIWELTLDMDPDGNHNYLKTYEYDKIGRLIREFDERNYDPSDLWDLVVVKIYFYHKDSRIPSKAETYNTNCTQQRIIKSDWYEFQAPQPLTPSQNSYLLKNLIERVSFVKDQYNNIIQESTTFFSTDVEEDFEYDEEYDYNEIFIDDSFGPISNLRKTYYFNENNKLIEENTYRDSKYGDDEFRIGYKTIDYDQKGEISKIYEREPREWGPEDKVKKFKNGLLIEFTDRERRKIEYSYNSSKQIVGVIISAWNIGFKDFFPSIMVTVTYEDEQKIYDLNRIIIHLNKIGQGAKFLLSDVIDLPNPEYEFEWFHYLFRESSILKIVIEKEGEYISNISMFDPSKNQLLYERNHKLKFITSSGAKFLSSVEVLGTDYPGGSEIMTIMEHHFEYYT